MRSEIVDFSELFLVCLRRWYWIALAATLAAVLSIAWTLAMPNQFRAEVVLSPVTDDPRATALESLTSSLGGLAMFAGIGGSGGNSIYETIAILESQSFGEKFITEQKLIPHFFSDNWDSASDGWREGLGEDEIPELWDAYKMFDRDIRAVRYDRLTGLVDVSFTWTDPELAARWLIAYVEQLNQSLRDDAIAEANRNLKYLEQQLESTGAIELREAIYRMIKAEIQTIMLARGRQEYALKTLSPAVEPTEKVAPRRAIIVVAATGLSGFFAAMFVIGLHWRGRRNAA